VTLPSPSKERRFTASFTPLGTWHSNCGRKLDTLPR
jgi:hypothetical protein